MYWLPKFKLTKLRDITEIEEQRMHVESETWAKKAKCVKRTITVDAEGGGDGKENQAPKRQKA
eukprot:12149423-Karenia_brevis.AAC.1